MIEEFNCWLVVKVLPGLPAKLAILALVAFFGYQAATVESRTAAEDFKLSMSHFKHSSQIR